MKVNIVGKHIKLSNKQKSYIIKRISNLEKYLPLSQREGASVEARISESWVKRMRRRHLAIFLRLKKKELVVSETASNVFVAADAAEDKLKTEIKKYKGIVSSPKSHRRSVNRWQTHQKAL